jgi:hypothetical protein
VFRDVIHNIKAARLDNANGTMTLFAMVGTVTTDGIPSIDGGSFDATSSTGGFDGGSF